jgi:hypothetical protein
MFIVQHVGVPSHVFIHCLHPSGPGLKSFWARGQMQGPPLLTQLLSQHSRTFLSWVYILILSSHIHLDLSMYESRKIFLTYFRSQKKSKLMTSPSCLSPHLLTHRPDDGGSTHLWNVGRHRFENTAVHPRRLWTSYSSPWEPEISHRPSKFLRQFTQLITDTYVNQDQIPARIFGLYSLIVCMSSIKKNCGNNTSFQQCL